MDSLANNDEQVICVERSEEKLAEEEEEDIVANKREFFLEADEVRAAISRVIDPTLDLKTCRKLCERIGDIWNQYQEQPGLLDPFLEQMVNPLMGAITKAVHESPQTPLSSLPNLHLLSSLLYILTMVRGYKTVSRFFPHEAADLEPCLEAAEVEAVAASRDTWSTLYCFTLWLGMVLLTPFDLRTIDSGGTKGLAVRILELGQKGLRNPSRTRDASAWMLAKYFTRPDVTAQGSLQSFHAWTVETWSPSGAGNDGHISIGKAFGWMSGALQAWTQTLKVAPRAVLKDVWGDVLALALQGPSGQGDADFKGSSLLRKLRIKVACRAALVALPPRLAPWRYERGARSLLVNFAQATGAGETVLDKDNINKNDNAASAAVFAAAEAKDKFDPPFRTENSVDGKIENEDEDEDVPEQVDEVVELLLNSLGDADTVVRWSAAKGIGRVTNRLSREFGDQVLESLFERCFSFRETDKAWHGGCLGLAELTRRGLLLPERLPTVVPLVCQALHFEQVSGNYAVGQHVRDAACYVCWAFARAYAPNVLEPFVHELAAALIQVAVYDREINCRRAAAAAVQEHVGRQGTFPDGIDVVTLADYWTLSVRRNAYLTVAPQIAQFGTYRRSLLDHLVDRKLQHQELQIRMLASQALAKLAEAPSEALVECVNKEVLPKLLARALDTSGAAAGSAAPAPGVAGSSPTASSVQSRHGAIIGVASLVEAMHDKVTPENQDAVRKLVPGLEKARAYRGRGGEVIRGAACMLLERIAVATSWPFKDATCTRYLQTVDECARIPTEAIQFAAVDTLRQLALHRFKSELCNKCVDTYIAGLQKSNETISARRAFVLCLGALPAATHHKRSAEILDVLCREIRGNELPGGKDMEDPSTRQFAVLSLGRLCLGAQGLTEVELTRVVETLEIAINDYATDRRGDVGSWVREVAVEVISALLVSQIEGTRKHLLFPNAEVTTKLTSLLLKQAVEKIDRLRMRVSALLCSAMLREGGPPILAEDYVELAYRRISHKEQYDLSKPEIPVDSPLREGEGPFVIGSSWPPAAFDDICVALRKLPQSKIGCSVGESHSGGSDNDIHIMSSTHVFETFDAFVPLLETEAYRAAITSGLIVTVGGVTESTAREARRALLRYLQVDPSTACSDSIRNSGRSQTAISYCDALIRIFERTKAKDSDPEARRILVPLLTTVGMLLAESQVPQAFAVRCLDQALRVTRNTKDLGRLRASISVFIGLSQWPGAVRRKSITTLLQFLGLRYPMVRQLTAKSLYLRLLQEEGALDLSGDATIPSIPAEAIAEILEIVTVTPWATDDEQCLVDALQGLYAKLNIELPTGGSVLAPKDLRDTGRAIGIGNEYEDLVKDAHAWT